MSVRGAARWVVWVWSSGVAPSVAHGGSLDVFRMFGDPLHAAPARLESGATLPGDPASVNCAGQQALDQALEQPLSLAQAVDISLCNNAQVRAAWAAIKVQAASLGQARAAYLPTLQGTASRLVSHTRYAGSDTPSTSSSGATLYASLTWRLFDFGGRAANEASAYQSLGAAWASHDAVLQATLNAVVEAYFDAVTAQATTVARSAALTVAEATLSSALRRQAIGAAGLSDTLQARTAVAKAALARSRAEGDYRKSLAMLGYVLGVPPGAHFTVNSVMDAERSDLPRQEQELDDWLAAAQAQHPSIVEARAQLEASRRHVDAVASDGLPSVDLTASRIQNGYPGQGLLPNRTTVNTIGVTLTVPFFDGFARSYEIRGAQAQVEQSEAQLLDVERQIAREVIRTHADAVSSSKNLSDSQTLVDAASDALASSERRYDKGAADILELLNAQGALADAQLERVRCLSEWTSARLSLFAAAGALGRERVASLGR